MPDFQTVLTVGLAGLALSATPGPSMLYVLSHSVGHGRFAGYASAIGLAIGGLILAIGTALGLATLFQVEPRIEHVLRFAGSIYLAWLGIGMLREAAISNDQAIKVRSVRRRSFLRIMKQGIWVELLNPKTVLFFALFIPPFVDPSAQSNTTLHLLVLGAIIPLTAIPSDLFVAWTGKKLAYRLRRSAATRRALAYMGGFTLVVIAVNLHLQLI